MTNKTYTLNLPADLFRKVQSSPAATDILGVVDYDRLKYNLSDDERYNCIFHACRVVHFSQYSAMMTPMTGHNASYEMFDQLGSNDTEFEIYDGAKLAIRLFITTDIDKLNENDVVAQMDAKIREYEQGLSDYDPVLRIGANGLDWDQILFRRGYDCFFVVRGSAVAQAESDNFFDMENEDQYYMYESMFRDSATEGNWKIIVDGMKGVKK